MTHEENEKTAKVPVSRIPGSLEFLEEEEEGFAPIDAFLYWLQNSFERIRIKYQNVFYFIHGYPIRYDDMAEDEWSDETEYNFGITYLDPKKKDDIQLVTENILEILDAPLIHDGKTPRQVLSKISFRDIQNY